MAKEYRLVLDDLGVGAAAHAGVKGIDRGNVLARELEVEDVHVLGDPPGPDGLRDGAEPVLDVPAQDDLRRGLAELGGQVGDHRVFQHVLRRAGVGRVVDVHAADRRPRLGDDAMIGVRRRAQTAA